MKEKTKKKTGMARLWELAFTKKKLTISACIFAVLSTIASFMPFIAIYFIISEIVVNFQSLEFLNKPYLIQLGWLAGGTAVLAIALNFIALMCSHLAAFNTLYILKLDFTRHLASLPMGFHTENSTGKMRKVVDENIEKLEGFIAHQLPDIAGSFAAPFVILVILFIFDWRLGIASFVPVLISFAIQMTAFSGDESAKMMTRYQNALEDMNNASVEYVRGISVVKAFNQTIYSFTKFYKIIKDYGQFIAMYTKSFTNPYVVFLLIINNIYMFLIPVIIWLSGGVSDYPAFALSALFYLLFSFSISGPLLKIMYVSSAGKQIVDGIARMDKVFDTEPLKETKNPKTTNSYSVSFDNVSFTYNGEGETEALSEVSFTATQGQVTALVGPSGSGKSTLANLIPRFYDVNSGAVKIGGVDIRNMQTDYLMSIVSFVFQDVFLFKQSILENLQIGNKNANREDIIKACKAAQCHDFIEKLPQSYDTVIGTNNVHLSGGERQRIVIARAILKDAPIIVLDEATAFADPENEQKIQLAFEQLMKNKTVIIIAHRLSTVRGADKIVVVDKGCIVEQGVHDDLVSSGGRYSHMWENYTNTVSWTFKTGKELA